MEVKFYMRQKLLSIFAYLGLAITMLVISAIADVSAGIAILLVFILPLIIVRVCKYLMSANTEKESTKSNRLLANIPADSIKIPITAKGREAAVNDLLTTISVDVSLANKTQYFSTYLEYYDEIIDALKKLKQFEGKYDFSKVMKYSSPTLELHRFENEFQWHLRDSIEEQADRIISDARNKYRNNKSQTRRDCQSFMDDVSTYRSRFDDETIELAERKLQELQQKLDVQLLEEFLTCDISSESEDSPYLKYGGVESELNNVDLMDGHAFEEWCAELLRKNDYSNVSVTRGSGDQGIDVLAEKNSIKYAIQCKCYSSDLGNTPVQEAHAGKDFYNCDIAVVMTNQHFTKGAKELAEKTRTRLWDRDTLREMIEAQNATAI